MSDAGQATGDAQHERVEGGHADLFDELFGRGYQLLCRNAGAGIGPDLRRHVDADDIVQEAFLKAFQLIDKADPRDRAGLLIWLRRITDLKIREKVRYWRCRKRFGAEEPAGGDFGLEQTAGTRAAPAPLQGRALLDQLDDREYLQMLFGSMCRLARDQRDVILMRDFFGISWVEITRILERPTVGAAQQLHLRARTELARLAGHER